MRELFRLPAVVGAGIGASRQEPGKPAIHVFVSRTLTAKERARFPKALETIPVEIQETGTLVAHSPGEVKFSVLSLTGSRQVREPSAYVITSPEQWRQFLSGTFGYRGDPPEMDFGGNTVVAIFAGERPSGGYAVDVQNVRDESAQGKPSRARVRYRIVSPAPAVAVIQALTYPYTVIRIAGRFDTVEVDPPVAGSPVR